MTDHPLDNPIWNSLVTGHADRAIGTGQARRYAPEVAPFAAVGTCSIEAAEELSQIVESGERVCVLGVAPEFSSAWSVFKSEEIVQMVWELETDAPEPDAEITPLTQEDLAAMLELTALVYPAYFRAGTADLGDYFGIQDQGRLCAMAGLRMSLTGHQELSGICTHPDYRGQGYARGLVRHLIRHVRAQGKTPFLHTEAENEVARALYEGLGFKLRRMIPFWVVDRQ